MTANRPTAVLDSRFGQPGAPTTPWPDAARVLETAELYWLSTVRADARPHVTPLIGLWRDGVAYFCTGPREQKARNLAHHPRVALTTGTNTWARGLDVVVEGTAVRITSEEALRELAEAFEAKYGAFWHFEVVDGAFRSGEAEDPAWVFRVEPSKVLAFAKDPHAQTTYRFG